MIVALSLDYRESLEHKIRLLIADGNTAAEIANRLGVNAQVVRRKLTEMAITAPRDTTRIPFGLSSETYALRSLLGGIVTDMIEKKVPQEKISEQTGLNRREISRAKARPYAHDWKLSQIERTLYTQGLTFKEAL